MNEFLQFNIGQVAQTVVFVVSMAALYFQLKGDVQTQNLRLESIEKEVKDFRQYLVNNARLEERIEAVRQIVVAQGKRLDWVSQRIYGNKRQTEEEEYLS